MSRSNVNPKVLDNRFLLNRPWEIVVRFVCHPVLSVVSFLEWERFRYGCIDERCVCEDVNLRRLTAVPVVGSLNQRASHTKGIRKLYASFYEWD
jgi:hypothetical protein